MLSLDAALISYLSHSLIHPLFLGSCLWNVLFYVFCKILLSHPHHFLSHVFLTSTYSWIPRLLFLYLSLRNFLSPSLNGSYLGTFERFYYTSLPF